MYQREAMAYDTVYVKSHIGDLNTTLVFVRPLHSFSAPKLTRALRLVCSLPSVPPS